MSTPRCDVLVIGTGTSAVFTALRCAKAGLDTAVVDARPYGGTCALRGCQPKKWLVATAEVVARGRDLETRGIAVAPTLAWADLMRAKRGFTEPIPAGSEKTFREAGVTTLHGRARFTGPTTVRIEGPDEGTLAAATVVIATGARPADLPFPGADLLTTSEEFLEMDAPPVRMVCVGGGFISLEFAHVAARAGVAVTVLHRGGRILPAFDPELVDALVEASREAGIDIRTGVEVTGVERDGPRLAVRAGDDGETFAADVVLHGAGRTPALPDLDLDAAGVEQGPAGVKVDPGMRSVSNPSVFAVGDAADGLPQLAPAADHEGKVAAANIIAGETVRRVEREGVPRVVFSLPPLAAVGLTAEQADGRDDVETRARDTSDWPSARRTGQRHAGFKVMQEKGTGRILGAHVLGHGAPDVVNVFALAIRHGLTAADLQDVLWAYPTPTSDVKKMVSPPDDD